MKNEENIETIADEPIDFKKETIIFLTSTKDKIIDFCNTTTQTVGKELKNPDSRLSKYIKKGTPYVIVGLIMYTIGYKRGGYNTLSKIKNCTF